MICPLPLIAYLCLDGSELPCRVTKTNSTTYECGYVPSRVGPHTVTITYGGAHIPRSPFPVAVGPYKESRIRAFGPGLEGGVVGFPADFVVETNGETGSLGMSMRLTVFLLFIGLFILSTRSS
jgi:filamin